jgi:Cu/Ag efflux pump CusA
MGLHQFSMIARRAMASIGRLVTCTLLTLLVLPAIDRWFDPAAEPVSRNSRGDRCVP